MRFRQLQLRAYGGFTDFTLDFGTDAGGIDLVYGPNESGKSTALRAISAFLFGFRAQTTDDWLHRYQDLRVAAVLEGADGTVEALVRRKGSSNTLLDDAGGVVGEDRLRTFLGPVDRETFETAFGLDHLGLVRGGEDLLAGRGDLAESLFQGATGIVGVREVLRQIDNEATAIWAPRARGRLLNAALDEHHARVKETRAHAVLASHWSELDERVRALVTRQADVRGRRAALQSERQRLERWKQALQRSERAVREEREAAARLEELKARLEELVVPGPLLAIADRVEALVERRGSHLKAMADLPGLRAEAEGLEREAARLLAQVRPDLLLEEAEALRLTVPARARLLDLADTHTRLTQALEGALEACRKTLADIEAREEGLAALPDWPDPASLKLALERTPEVVAEEKRRAGQAAELEALTGELQVARERLPALGAARQDLDRLEVPLLETVDAFEARLDDAAGALARLERDLAANQVDAADLATQADALRTEAEVPTEEDLGAARRHRDRGWSLVRAEWLEGRMDEDARREYDPDHDLAEAYEASVQASDGTADRLRRESGRVERLALLLARRRQTEAKAEELVRERGKAAEDLEAIRAEWVAAWAPSGIQPRPPREMRAWLRQLDDLRAELRRRLLLQTEIARADEAVAAAREALVEAMTAVDPAARPGTDALLSAMVQQARDLLQRVQGDRSRRREAQAALIELRESLRHHERKVEESRAGLAGWQSLWAEAVEVLGLGPEPLPVAVRQVLDRLGDVFDRRDRARDLRLREAAIQADADAFRMEVQACCGLVAPELAGLEEAAAVARLRDELAAGVDARARRDALAAQIEEWRSRLDQAHADGSDALRDMADLAGDEAHARAPAEAIGEWLEQAEADAVTSLADLDAEHDVVAQELAEARLALGQVDGGDRAAEAAQAAEEALAAVRQLVERYVLLRLAAEGLTRAMEALRKRNQDPVLRRAGDWFSRLTNGSFDGLVVGFDRDRQVLVGRRADGREVVVEGMSDGTRDQLYLALRLASLQVRAGPESLPLVLDDILIHFDDDRARSALGVLGEVSATRQVLFFTHHARMIELAGETGGSWRLHRL